MGVVLGTWNDADASRPAVESRRRGALRARRAVIATISDEWAEQLAQRLHDLDDQLVALAARIDVDSEEAFSAEEARIAGELDAIQIEIEEAKAA